MHRMIAWGLAVLVIGAIGMVAITPGAASQNEPLKEGELVAAFDVYDVTGPHKGTELCYR